MTKRQFSDTTKLRISAAHSMQNILGVIREQFIPEEKHEEYNTAIQDLITNQANIYDPAVIEKCSLEAKEAKIKRLDDKRNENGKKRLDEVKGK